MQSGVPQSATGSQQPTASAQQQVPAPPQVAAGPAPSALPSPNQVTAAPRSGATIDHPNPLLLKALLAMLGNKKKSPESMAERLATEAGRRDDLAGLLNLVIDSPDEDLPVLLSSWVEIPGWGQVAEWLLANPEYTARLVAELRRLAPEEEPDGDPA